MYKRVVVVRKWEEKGFIYINGQHLYYQKMGKTLTTTTTTTNHELKIMSSNSNSNSSSNNSNLSGTIPGFFRRLLPLHALPHDLPPQQMKEELKSLARFAGPIIMTSFLIYSRSVVSMLFLGHLGKAELAGGSLALGFGNITGISILRGLSTGMDPICCQAFGAKRWSVLSQTFLKTLCLLLLVSIPISILWLNMEPILLWLGQDPAITQVAKVYMVFSIPELLAQAHHLPLRIFLRTQGITTPITVASVASALLHPPINYFLVTYLKLGVEGVALSLAWNTLNLNVGLMIYLALSSKPLKPWHGVTILSTFQGWQPLLSLAIPSAVSVCLEWWWYEIMLFLCGLLNNPQNTVAAMGILIQTTGMLYIVPFSLSAGITTRIGHALGAGEPIRAQWTAIIGLSTGLAFGLTAFLFMTSVRSVWGKLYTDEPEILRMISSALPVLGLCEISNSPQTVACGVLTGTARPKLGARINLYAFYFIGLPVAVLATFTLKTGFLGLWFGLMTAQISCLCMLVRTLLRTDWIQQSVRAVELAAAVGEETAKEEEDVESGALIDDNADDDHL